jgi:gliding motility-associated-like protein
LTGNQTYTVTGTANGCTNTATATVTVTPRPNVTVNNPTICSGLTATLTANGATTYSWSGGLGSSNSVTTPVLTGNQTYIVTGTSNGCTNTATSTVTVRPRPVVTVTNPSICINTTATLTAGGATTYTWSNGLGSAATATTPVLTANQTYTVTGSTNGCTGSATASVTVNPKPVVSVNNAVICTGSSAILTASGASTYTWSGGLGTGTTVTTAPLSSNQNFTVTGTANGCTGTAVAAVTLKPVKTTPLTRTICADENVTVGSQTFNQTGNYSVTLQTSQNCDSIVNLNLTVIDVLVPEVSITASKTDICPGNSVTFTATASNTGLPPTYQWFVNNDSVGTNSTQFSTAALNNGDKVKVMISTASTCAIPNTASSNEITITKNSVSYTKPVVAYCKTDSQTIDLGISAVPNTPFTVKWTNAGTVSTFPDGLYTVSNQTNSTIPFEITYGNNCKVNDVLRTSVLALPVINAVSDIADAKYEEEVQLNVLTNAQLSYNWQPAAQVSNDTVRNPTSVITATTIFTVNVTDNNNCRNSDTVLVRLIDECTEDFIYVPSAFSPNGDGVNDCFSIIAPPRLSDFNMTVFNRWGEKVFEAKDEFTCWDGTFKGASVMSDAHMYVISFVCYNGKKLSKKGTVTIMR